MALVICRVLITLRIRRRISRMFAISRWSLVVGQNQDVCHPERSRSSGAAKDLPHHSPRYLAVASFCVASLSDTNCCLASLITFCNWPFNVSSRIFFSMIARSRPGLVESTYLRYRQIVEESACARHDDQNLFGERQGGELILLQQFDQALSAIQL